MTDQFNNLINISGQLNKAKHDLLMADIGKINMTTYDALIETLLNTYDLLCFLALHDGISSDMFKEIYKYEIANVIKTYGTSEHFKSNYTCITQAYKEFIEVENA